MSWSLCPNPGHGSNRLDIVALLTVPPGIDPGQAEPRDAFAVQADGHGGEALRRRNLPTQQSEVRCA